MWLLKPIERGWDRIVIVELIAQAEAAGFEILLTTGKNMRYQQNLTGRKIAFVVIHPNAIKQHLQARRLCRSLEGIMIMLDMPKEIEAQFAAAAQARGVPLSDYVRDFVVEHYQEDADDLRAACERLADLQPGVTSNQLRKNLGLDGSIRPTGRKRPEGH